MEAPSEIPKAEGLSVPARIKALEGEILRLRLSALDVLVRTTVDTIAGRGAFSAIEVWEHARLVSPELRDALAQAEVGSVRRLGKLLQRLQGRSVGGWRLERLGADHDGAVWMFRECADDSQALSIADDQIGA